MMRMLEILVADVAADEQGGRRQYAPLGAPRHFELRRQ
jgi:hypothetical protein